MAGSRVFFELAFFVLIDLSDRAAKKFDEPNQIGPRERRSRTVR